MAAFVEALVQSVSGAVDTLNLDSGHIVEVRRAATGALVCASAREVGRALPAPDGGAVVPRQYANPVYCLTTHQKRAGRAGRTAPTLAVAVEGYAYHCTP